MNARTHAQTRSKLGFTLVEMMVAMTILGFGMLGVAAAQVNTMRNSRSSKNLSAAVEVAQNEMEGLIRLGWTDLPAAAWTTPVKASSQVNGSVEILDQDYMVSRRIAEPVAGTLRSVDVRVSWEGATTGTRTFSITTLRFNDGS